MEENVSQLRSRAARVSLAGAIISVGATIFVGRANPSRLLILIMAMWVASPFALMTLAGAMLRRTRRGLSAAVYWTMIVVSMVSVMIYVAEARWRFTAKDAFVFVIVPPVSWLVLVVAAAIGGGAGPRPSKPRSV